MKHFIICLSLYCAISTTLAAQETSPYRNYQFQIDLPPTYTVIQPTKDTLTIENETHTCRIYFDVFTSMIEQTTVMSSMQVYMANRDQHFVTIPITEKFLHYDITQIPDHLQTSYDMPALGIEMDEIIGSLPSRNMLYIMFTTQKAERLLCVQVFDKLLTTLQVME